MRAAAVLFLPALAALALVGALELATGGAKPVEPQSFVWKKRVFTSKREFTVWLGRRNVRYADWAARHPGASPPWKEERGGGSSSGDDDGLGVLPLLAAALAAIAVLFVLTRASASRFARGARRSLLARLRTEETLRPLVVASGAAALRHAVSVYGLRPARGDEPPQEPAPPELVLVEAPPPLVVESRAVVDPKPEMAAIELPQRAAAVAEPEPVVEALPTRRRHPMRAAEQIAVDTPPRMDAAAAEESARREPEPEPEPAASTPEPDPVAVAAPPKRGPAKRQARKAAVETAPREESPSSKEPVRLQPEPAPEPEPEPAASISEPEPEPVVGGAAPRRRGRRTRRGQEPETQITQSAEPARVEEPVAPESIARPAASAGVSEPEIKPIDHLPLPAPAPESPSSEPAPVPVAPRSFETQEATEPPSLPVREVLCEVSFWRGYRKGKFYARIWGDDGMSAIATSPLFRCRSETPEQTDECFEALAALHDLLVAEGWEPNGQGRAWYARRFTNQVPA